MAQNNFCYAMFFIYLSILFFVTVAIIIYHQKRKRVTKDPNTALYYMVLFISMWITSRAMYFSDTWHNYNWIVLGWVSSIPIFFTFACFMFAIDSM